MLQGHTAHSVGETGVQIFSRLLKIWGQNSCVTLDKSPELIVPICKMGMTVLQIKWDQMK